MSTQKILVLLPDGIGLRNFVFSKFPELVKQNQIELEYWNATTFNLTSIELNSIPLRGNPHYKTDLMKRARKQIEINKFYSRFKNDIYHSYLFKTNSNKIKDQIKLLWVNALSKKYNNDLEQLREKIKSQERKTDYYRQCFKQLQECKPDLLFCSNQRPLNAIAPILAAQDLGIPTVTFIFSWDNLPKATMVIETDYYLVWSDFMAKQLCEYYSYIQESQISVTGSPQFEVHFNEDYQISKNEFCKQYNIPVDKQLICFSGDDVTTSPHDPEYLKDVCEAIKQLNLNGENLALVFRPCPVDFSNRYDKVLEDYNNIVFKIRPFWTKAGNSWNTVMPTQADQALLHQTIAHCDLIINLGSSMVFDAVCQNKPCAYINYNPDVSPLQKDVNHIYKYIHFQSMPDKNAVIWLNSKNEITEQILEGIANPKPYVSLAKEWFKIINENPTQMASKRIVEALISIINK